VLFPWAKYAYEYALENNYTNLSLEEFLEHEEFHTPLFWHNLVRIPMIYYKTRMNKSYVDLLNLFNKAGWEIFYLTNRPEEVKAVTYNWLEDAKVPQLCNLYFVDKKSSIIRYNDINYHIDDRKKCIEDVKNFCPTFLINTYWNRDYKEPSNCKRISNLLEVEELLDA
jgi:uncharacterized HAD superfamily protein